MKNLLNLMQCFWPYCTCCVRPSMCWFAVSYSDIDFHHVIYFNLSLLDYTEPHSETWILRRRSLPLPSGLVKKHFSDEQRLDVRADLSVMLMYRHFHSAQLSLPKLSSCRSADGDRGDPMTHVQKATTSYKMKCKLSYIW